MPSTVSAKQPTATRRRPRYGLVLLAVALAAVVFVVVQGLHFGFGWLNPFGETTKDRSGPVVLRSIRDLSRYEAATGQFQVVVDLDKEANYLPSVIRGRRTLFVGNGSVNAYVDFSKIASGAVTVSPDRKTATVRLPPAQLEPTRPDPKNSYVFATQTGLLDRIGQFFGGNPNDQQQLYILAAQKIQAAAEQTGLR